MPKIEIYTSPLCGFCHAAKRLLNQKGVSFVEFDVSREPGLRQTMMERANGGYTVPPHYDSLIAKLLVFGHDRAQAGLVPLRADHPAFSGADLERGVLWMSNAVFPAFARFHPAPPADANWFRPR